MRSIAALMTIGVLLFAPSRLVAREPNPGLDELRGSWKQVSKERNGEKLDVKEVVCTFGDGTFQTKTAGTASESGTIRVDVDKKPKTYDVTITGEFKEKGDTYHGIFVVDGDTLKTCVNSNAGEARPTEFATQAGSGHQMIVWKRVKP